MSTDDKFMNDMTEAMGGKEGIRDVFVDAASDKIIKEGFINYTPPERRENLPDDEMMGRMADSEGLNLQRSIFSEERQMARNAINQIFQDMKDPDIETSTQLNPEYQVNITEEDLDYFMDAFLAEDAK